MNRRSIMSLVTLVCLSVVILILSCTKEQPSQVQQKEFTGTISGYVFDVHNAPISDAVVSIDADSAVPGMSDSRGHFLVGKVESGAHTLHFTHRDYEDDTSFIVHVLTGQQVTMKDTVRLSSRFLLLNGTVMYKGAPAPAAGVALAGTSLSTLTDENGVFQLTSVPKNITPKLICAKDTMGFYILVVTQTLKSDDTNQVGNITLGGRGADVSGTVYDANNLPLPWVVVQAVGGGINTRTDQNGSYYLKNVPTGEDQVRISVVTTDSSMVGALSGIALSEGSVATGMDIRLHRISSLVNGMALDVQDLIIADTIAADTVRVFPSTDVKTLIKNYSWQTGGVPTVTIAPSLCFDLSKVAGSAPVTVYAMNANGDKSAVAGFTVTRRNTKPVIRSCGGSTDLYGTLQDTVHVNKGIPVYLSVDIDDPVGGVDSCFWSFGNGMFRQTNGVFRAPLEYAYQQSGKYQTVMHAKDINGHDVFDTVYVVVNTPPKIVTSQAIRNSAVAGGEYRFVPQADDADGDTAKFHLLSSIASMTMLGDTIDWKPVSKDTGLYSVTLQADDGHGGYDTISWNISVVKVPATNADLDSIVISDGQLSPKFDSGTTRYYVSVGSAVAFFRLKPVAHDVNALVAVNNAPVAPGRYTNFAGLFAGVPDTFTIDVTAQDGITHKTYAVIVARDMGQNALLSSLQVSEGTLIPQFASNIALYTDSVSALTTAFLVRPTSADANSKILVNGALTPSGGNSGAIQLVSGPDTVAISVLAEDTTVKNLYRVIVLHRASSIAVLSGLSVSVPTSVTTGLAPSFNTDTLSYHISLTRLDTGILIRPAVLDPTSTVTVNDSAVVSGQYSQSVRLKAGNDTILVAVTAQDKVTKRTYTIVATRAAGTSADLQSLTAPTVFLPAFSPSVTTYYDTVENEATTYSITPVAVDPGALIVVNSDTVYSGHAASVPLGQGTTAITVKVKSEDNATTKTWSVLVLRKTDVALAALTISAGTLAPVFNPESLSYRVTVPFDTTAIRIGPAARQPSIVSSIMVKGTALTSGLMSGSISLSVGANVIPVVVNGSDGASSRTYTLAVTRTASSNARLSSLSLNVGTLRPVFNPDTLVYADSVDTNVSSIQVLPTRENQTASITVNGQPVVSGSYSQAIALVSGLNTIPVIVTAGDSSTQRKYALNVYRAPNRIVNLSNLVVSGGALTPAFVASDTSYTVYVPYESTTVTIKPTAVEPRATIKVNGTVVPSGTASSPISLPVGNTTITVAVTAMDQATKKTTTILITRHPQTSTYNLGLHVTTIDTLLKANSPYHFVQSILIDSGATLIIQPGVVLEMDSGASVDVRGLMIAQGTQTDSIIFRAYNTARPWGYIYYEKSAVDATFDGNGNYTGGNILGYCVVEYAGASTQNAVVNLAAYPYLWRSTIQFNSLGGIYCGNESRTGTNVIRECTIANNSSSLYVGAGVGISYSNSHLVLRKCTIEGNNGAHTIYATFSQGMVIDSCLILNNTVTSDIVNNASNTGSMDISNSAIIGNYGFSDIVYGSLISIHNCTISGNRSKTGFMVDGSTDTLENVTFASDTIDTISGSGKLSLLNFQGGYIGNCNFLNNSTTYDLYDNASYPSPNLNATNCYWNTTDENVIKQLIYDWFDDNTKGSVNYAPFLTAPDPNCPAPNWTPLP